LDPTEQRHNFGAFEIPPEITAVRNGRAGAFVGYAQPIADMVGDVDTTGPRATAWGCPALRTMTQPGGDSATLAAASPINELWDLVVDVMASPTFDLRFTALHGPVVPRRPTTAPAVGAKPATRRQPTTRRMLRTPGPSL
jgi:hypothetical protein